jgi:hypothetical protein
LITSQQSELSSIPPVSVEKPLVFTLNENEPWDWYYKFIPPSFNNKKLTKGDVYKFSYSFTSNIDIDFFRAYFSDYTVEADNFYTPLCSTEGLLLKMKANVEYKRFSIYSNKQNRKQYRTGRKHIFVERVCL